MLRGRRGSGLVEFTLCAIPIIFVCISLFWVTTDVWEYHTLAEAVNETARYASVHGSDCAATSCATTVQQIANVLAGRAVGIPPGSMNVTLTSSAATYTCNPLSSCQSGTGTGANTWPSLAGNTPVGGTGGGTNISITASFLISEPKDMYVPGKGVVKFTGATLEAQSTQPVLY